MHCSCIARCTWVPNVLGGDTLVLQLSAAIRNANIRLCHKKHIHRASYEREERTPEAASPFAPVQGRVGHEALADTPREPARQQRQREQAQSHSNNSNNSSSNRSSNGSTRVYTPRHRRNGKRITPGQPPIKNPIQQLHESFVMTWRSSCRRWCCACLSPWPLRSQTSAVPTSKNYTHETDGKRGRTREGRE